MIIVQGLIPIKPETFDDALIAARRMAAATRAEDGCISYDFYVGLSDPHTLMLFQEWEDLDALAGHFQTEHMDEFLAVLPQFAAGEIVTRRFEVQSRPEEDEPPRGDDDDEAPRVIH